MTMPTRTPPTPPPYEITPGQMFAAFGMARTTFMRRLREGDVGIPQPNGFAGKHRRWTAEQLPDVVACLRAMRRPVPAGWDTETKGGSK